MRQVCEGGEGEEVHLLHGEQDHLGGKGAREEVNLRPDHPDLTVSSAPFLDCVNDIASSILPQSIEIYLTSLHIVSTSLKQGI